MTTPRGRRVDAALRGYGLSLFIDGEIILTCDRCGLAVAPPDPTPQLHPLVTAAREHSERVCTG